MCSFASLALFTALVAVVLSQNLGGLTNGLGNNLGDLGNQLGGMAGAGGAGGMTNQNGGGLIGGSNGISLCASILDCQAGMQCCGNNNPGLLSGLLGPNGLLEGLPLLGGPNGLFGRCAPICLLGELNL